MLTDDRRTTDRRWAPRGGRRSQDATPAELDRIARVFAAEAKLAGPAPASLVCDVLSASMNRVGALSGSAVDIEEHYDERFRDDHDWPVDD